MPDDITPNDARRARRSGRPVRGRPVKARAQLEERFVETRDGHRLFVRTWRPAEAKGPALVLTDGLGCQGYAWAYIVDAFKGERPIVAWQYRGHGRSPVPDDLDSLTVETMVNDLEDVLAATGIERAVFLGYSMGVQVVLEAVRRLTSERAAPSPTRAAPDAPLPDERVAGLVLLCGSFERPLDTWHNLPERYRPPTLTNRVMRRVFPYLSGAFLQFPEHAQQVWQKLIPTRLSYQLALLVELNGRRIDYRDFWPYLQHIGSMDMRVFSALARALSVHSAGDVLPTIEAPTLIIAGARDTFAPLWISEEMHRKIPGSEILVVRDGTHATPVEHPQLINLRLEKFFRERVRA